MMAAREGEHSAVELKLVKRRPLAAILSSVGVGTTPPNALVTPKPVSSVIISSTFGAPLGGTTRAGQYGVDCAALRSILPAVAVADAFNDVHFYLLRYPSQNPFRSIKIRTVLPI